MKDYTFQEKLLIFLDSFLGFEYKFKFELLDYVEKAESEEEFLERELAGYAEYKQKVKYRLIPFIW